MRITAIKDLSEGIRYKKLIFLSVVLMLALGLLLFSNHGIVNRIRLENNKSGLVEQITLEKVKSDSLKLKIKRLLYDTLEIERIAREQLGMVKPGEQVYFLKEDIEEKAD